MPIQLNQVAIEYNHTTQQLGIKDINFSVYPGEVLAIIGRSGCGKSTLLRAIAGLQAINSGTLITDNTNIKLVFQNHVLLPWLTVKDNIRFGLNKTDMYSVQAEHDITRMLDLIQLSEVADLYPKQISGGMSQRVSFARALISEPEVLLLDEAFSALDVATAEQLRQDFFTWFCNGEIKTKSVIMTTHNLDEALNFADRLLVLAGSPGKIINIIDLRKRKYSLTELKKMLLKT